MLKGRLERAVSAAGELERAYNWLGAAALYRKAVNLMPPAEFLRKGEMEERVGHCFFRAGFQAQTPEEFKRRLRRALESYEKTHGFYERLTDGQKAAMMFRCDAVASYLGFWLTADPSEQRRRLDECLERETNALQAFSEAGDMVEYGRTYSAVPLVFWLRARLEGSGQARKRIYERGVEWGETIVAVLSDVETFPELAQAYFTLCTCLRGMRDFIPEPEAQEQNDLKIAEYLHRAIALAERTNNVLVLGLLKCWLPWWIQPEEGRERMADEALRCGEKTWDNHLIAWSLSTLSALASVKAYAEEDPARWKELMEEACQFYDRAHRLYSSIPIPSLSRGWMDFPHGWLFCYHQMADREVVLEKRLGFLTKAEAAGAKALRVAESSGLPEYIGITLAYLSGVHLDRSKITAVLAEKRRRLETAVRLKERVCQIRKEITPFAFQSKGVGLTTLAITKMYLAEVELNLKARQRFLEEAALSMEKGLKLYDKDMLRFEKRGTRQVFAVLHRDQDYYATLLKRLYHVTRNPEYLRRAIAVSQQAINSSNKLDMVSRMAESYWKIATVQDLLSDHQEAAESFNQASIMYRRAAERFPLLMGFYSDYAVYMRAWADVERARRERAHEDHVKAGEHCRRCSRRLELTEKWAYLSAYYLAWSRLEDGEALSKRDAPHDAMKAFDEAGRAFRDSAERLRKKVKQLEPSEEKDAAVKLTDIAGLRRQYCLGRVLMEEAKLASRAGDRLAGAEKYAAAARIFEAAAPNLEGEDDRSELQFATAICDAWEQMELAEDQGDSVLFQKAAELFARASRTSYRKTAKSTAMGASCFCEALALGMQFLETSCPEFYSGAKTRMEHAAGYYQRAGLTTPAVWVEATKRLFDAYVYAGKAEAEADPEKRVRLYLMAEKALESSAKSYGKARYRGRRNEVLQSLERMRKERALALSLSKVLSAPTVLSSATGVAMPDLTEQATGLNDFESVNIRARVAVPKEFVPNEEVQLKLDVVNVGKEPGLLVRIDGLVPTGCEVLRVPSHCTVEGTSVNMGGRMLGPLAVESVIITVQFADVVDVRLSPRVVYVDERGQFRTLQVEATQIRPVIEFESKAAQAVFNYLVNAFVEDRFKRRLGVEKSGWRSCPQIIKAARVSKRSLYGPSGRLGYGVSELQRTGLVDLDTLYGKRGRGGHVLRVRIHHEKEAVRRCVEEKAPDVLT